MRGGGSISRLVAAALAVSIGACATKPVDEDGLPARRADVTAALYRQLELVLSERSRLDPESPLADKRRESLDRMADEIALRIVRVDPDVDLEKLQDRLTGPSSTAASTVSRDGT